MSFKKYNISKPEKYIKDGMEKTYWANVGTLTEFEKPDGTFSRLVEIPAIGLKANAFPVENKEDPNRPASFPRRESFTTDANDDVPGVPF